MSDVQSIKNKFAETKCLLHAKGKEYQKAARPLDIVCREKGEHEIRGTVCMKAARKSRSHLSANKGG